jgi:hypothetical protein
MNSYDFIVVFDLPYEYLSDDDLDALYEAGCGDALFGKSTGVLDADFSREADDILDAVVSAIYAIETTVTGAVVVRVEPDDLVSIGDIAERTGRTNESIRLLVNGRRGPGDFPLPATRIGTGHSRLWRWAEVFEWFHKYEGDRWSGETARYWSVIAAVNDFLRQRQFANRSDSVAAQVRAALVPALERGCLAVRQGSPSFRQ